MNTHPLLARFRSAYALLIRVGSVYALSAIPPHRAPLLGLAKFFQTWAGASCFTTTTLPEFFYITLHIPFPGAVMPPWWVSRNALAACFSSPASPPRLAALPLIVTLLVAYLTDGIDVVKNIFNEPDKFVTAEPFLFLFAAVIVVIFGPGVFSIDFLLEKKCGAGASASTPPGASS